MPPECHIHGVFFHKDWLNSGKWFCPKCHPEIFKEKQNAKNNSKD